MATTVQIGHAAEQAVVVWLKSKGYRIDRWDTASPGSTDIEGSHSSAHVLVQVKSAIPPSQPASLSLDETRNIKARASKIGAQPWLAQVRLDSQLGQLGDISWTKLD